MRQYLLWHPHPVHLIMPQHKEKTAWSPYRALRALRSSQGLFLRSQDILCFHSHSQYTLRGPHFVLHALQGQKFALQRTFRLSPSDFTTPSHKMASRALFFRLRGILVLRSLCKLAQTALVHPVTLYRP
jgi:hypothetical protein